MNYFQELPLVIFTLSAQMAVGIVLVGQCLLGCFSLVPAQSTIRKQSLVALVLFGLAAILSLAHTGTPLHGPYTIMNLANSWLSREIAMVGLTGLLMLWLAFMRFQAVPNRKERLAAILVVLAGILLIYVMSGVYNQKTMPGWNNMGVFPSFLASGLMLGALWHALVLGFSRREFALDACAVSPLVLWGLLGLVLMAFSLPLALPDPDPLVNPAVPMLPVRCLASGHAAHAALSGLGVLIMVLAALKAAAGRGVVPLALAAAFLLLLAGEVIGRLTFYLSYSRLGM